MYALLRQQMLRAGMRMRLHPVAGLHTSAALRELSKFTMPAMSPTMESGGIAAWHKKEGESFNSCLLYTSPSPRDVEEYRMPSSA